MINHLVDFKQLLESEPEEMKVLGAKFKVDFGPWKQGDCVDILRFEYEEGRLTEYTMKGEAMRFCYVGLVAVAAPCPPNKPLFNDAPFDRFLTAMRERIRAEEKRNCGCTTR